MQAVQYLLKENNITNLAPRMFAFVHLAMWQALVINNDTSRTPEPAQPVAVASKLIPSRGL